MRIELFDKLPRDIRLMILFQCEPYTLRLGLKRYKDLEANFTPLLQKAYLKRHLSSSDISINAIVDSGNFFLALGRFSFSLENLENYFSDKFPGGAAKATARKTEALVHLVRCNFDLQLKAYYNNFVDEFISKAAKSLVDKSLSNAVKVLLYEKASQAAAKFLNEAEANAVQIFPSQAARFEAKLLLNEAVRNAGQAKANAPKVILLSAAERSAAEGFIKQAKFNAAQAFLAMIEPNAVQALLKEGARFDSLECFVFIKDTFNSFSLGKFIEVSILNKTENLLVLNHILDHNKSEYLEVIRKLLIRWLNVWNLDIEVMVKKSKQVFDLLGAELITSDLLKELKSSWLHGDPTCDSDYAYQVFITDRPHYEDESETRIESTVKVVKKEGSLDTVLNPYKKALALFIANANSLGKQWLHELIHSGCLIMASKEFGFDPTYTICDRTPLHQLARMWFEFTRENLTTCKIKDFKGSESYYYFFRAKGNNLEEGIVPEEVKIVRLFEHLISARDTNFLQKDAYGKTAFQCLLQCNINYSHQTENACEVFLKNDRFLELKNQLLPNDNSLVLDAFFCGYFSIANKLRAAGFLTGSEDIDSSAHCFNSEILKAICKFSKVHRTNALKFILLPDIVLQEVKPNTTGLLHKVFWADISGKEKVFFAEWVITNRFPRQQKKEIADFLNLQDEKGRTVFHFVKSTEEAIFLIKNGADVNRLNLDGQTLFKSFLLRGSFDILNILMENKCLVNQPILPSKPTLLHSLFYQEFDDFKKLKCAQYIIKKSFF